MRPASTRLTRESNLLVPCLSKQSSCVVHAHGGSHLQFPHPKRKVCISLLPPCCLALHYRLTESWGFHARVAVVTGGNKGIGLEVCRQLAGNGVTVVLTARDETRGAAAAEKLGELGLSGVIFHQLDITDASSIARLADFLKIRFGRLDILVSLLPKVCYGRSAW